MMNTLQNQNCVKSAKGGTARVRLDLEMIMFLPRKSCILETGRCINALANRLSLKSIPQNSLLKE